MYKRVVITGVGVLAPKSVGKTQFWKTLQEGKSGISKLSRFDSSNYRSRIAGEIDINISDQLSYKKTHRLSLFSQLALIAAKDAIEDSQFDLMKVPTEDIGVVFGTAAGGMDKAEKEHDVMREKGLQRVNPLFTAAYIPNAASGEVSVEFDIKGLNLTISTACSSGANAIGYAFESIRHGKATIVIAGAAETPLNPLTYGAFSIAHQLSALNDFPDQAARPFERNRDGMVLSEGSAVIILEELKHALARDAKIYAEVVGYGVTADAYSMQTLEPTGGSASRAIDLAMKMAKLNHDDIDYICAHAVGSLLGDRKETNAIKKSFKDYAYGIPISSIKSMIGHPFGASGALQVVASLLPINRNIIPPTINFDIKDPECDLNYVPNSAIKKKVNTVLLNSFGLGGNNASLIIKKLDKVS